MVVLLWPILWKYAYTCMCMHLWSYMYLYNASGKVIGNRVYWIGILYAYEKNLYPINSFVQKHCHTFFSYQVVATDADLAEPYNLVVYDTAGTARAEQYFDVDVTSGIIFVKRDLRFPTSQTSEMFVLDIQVSITEEFISITPLFVHLPCWDIICTTV